MNIKSCKTCINDSKCVYLKNDGRCIPGDKRGPKCWNDIERVHVLFKNDKCDDLEIKSHLNNKSNMLH